MDDDFNTSKGLAVIFSFVSQVNSIVGDAVISQKAVNAVTLAKDTIFDLLNAFGLDLHYCETSQAANNQDSSYPKEILDIAKKFVDYNDEDMSYAAEKLLEARTQARADKD